MINNHLLYPQTNFSIWLRVDSIRNLNYCTCSRPNKAEVNNQLSKRIKHVKFNRGGEYYDIYDRSGEQGPPHFAKFLDECEIIPLYTMSSSPSMNSVTER